MRKIFAGLTALAIMIAGFGMKPLTARNFLNVQRVCAAQVHVPGSYSHHPLHAPPEDHHNYDHFLFVQQEKTSSTQDTLVSLNNALQRSDFAFSASLFQQFFSQIGSSPHDLTGVIIKRE